MRKRLRPIILLAVAIALGVLAFRSWSPEPDDPIAPPVLLPEVVQVQTEMTLPTNTIEAKVRRIAVAQPQAVAETDTSMWARRLAERGGRSDLEAWIETFEEALQCLLYHEALEAFSLEQKTPNFQNLDEIGLKFLQDLDQFYMRMQSNMDRTKDLCAGSDASSVFLRYHEAWLIAALSGDPVAQRCFINAGFNSRYREDPSYKGLLALQYRQYAPNLVQAGLERADPYIAWLAMYRFIALPNDQPNDDVPLPDPYLTWRATRLVSLRSTPEVQASYDSALALMEESGLISAHDIERADAWAANTYARDYFGQPPIDLQMDEICRPRSWQD